MENRFDALLNIAKEKDAEKERQQQLKAQEKQQKQLLGQEWTETQEKFSLENVADKFFHDFAAYMGLSEQIGSTIKLISHDVEYETVEYETISAGMLIEETSKLSFLTNEIILNIQGRTLSCELLFGKKFISNQVSILLEINPKNFLRPTMHIHNFDTNEYKSKFYDLLLIINKNNNPMLEITDWKPMFEKIFQYFQEELQQNS